MPAGCVAKPDELYRGLNPTERERAARSEAHLHRLASIDAPAAGGGCAYKRTRGPPPVSPLSRVVLSISREQRWSLTLTRRPCGSIISSITKQCATTTAPARYFRRRTPAPPTRAGGDAQSGKRTPRQRNH